MTVLVLQLSDIHIKSDKDPILSRAKAISAVANPQAPSASLIIIAVTGDIAYSGTAEQYAAAEKFISEIRTLLAEETEADIRVVVVPGNHDCNFDLCNESRANNIASLRTNPSSKVDESVIDSCTSVQSAFFEFKERIENWEQVNGDKLWRTMSAQVGSKHLRIDALNVSWVSTLKEQKNLYFPIERYTDRQKDVADVRLVLMHHPFNWYHPSKYREFRILLRQISSLIMTGHEHEPNVGLIDEADSKQSAYIEGAVLQHDNMDLAGTGFNLTSLDLENGKFNSVAYRYVKGGSYVADPDSSWEDFHDLPVVTRDRAVLAEEFRRVLQDPGALFGVHGFDLNLGDVFVYPDLREIAGGPKSRRKFIDAKSLREPGKTKGGVILEGDDRCGCTSLLRQLYLYYLDSGFFPILVEGSDLKKTNDQEIDGLLKRAVKSQYEKSSVDSVITAPRAKKIILIDDFDQCPIADAAARALLVNGLGKRAAHMILSVNKLFEIKELIERDAEKAIGKMPHYEIQPFGFTKRGELIARWFSLKNADLSINEGQMIDSCDKAERVINAAMDKSIIPSAPLYLLTLLQSIDVGRSGDLKESALGYYYQFLLTEAFTAAGVQKNKLNEVFDYVRHLAWRFHLAGTQHLSREDLKSFNGQFSDDYTTVDFEDRLELLLKARVLQGVGASFSFRYPYIYYYLKGAFLASILLDEEARKYVKHCCDHLYVRDYANTVLFLAHHTNDPWLLESIASSLARSFEGTPELTFGEDAKEVVRLISGAPQLVYSGTSPVEQRSKLRAESDKRESGDGLLEKEVSKDKIGLATQLAMLFKNVEILGQILKNQYSSIKRTQKQQLIAALFKGPLRALGKFYAYYENNPDTFVQQLVSVMEKQSDPEAAKAAARRFVANIFLGVTFGIVHKSSRSANADELLEDVRITVKNESTTAFRIFELAILLDTAKDVPRAEIERLLKDTKNDILVETLLSIMVLNRLYMFKTSRTDMNWVSATLKIGMETQHQIAYQNSGRQLA